MTVTEQPPAARPRTRRGIVGLAVIAAGAFAFRLWMIGTVGRRNPDGGDPLYYHVQANLLAKGHWFVEPFAWLKDGALHPSAVHPPLFTMWLSLPSLVGWDSFWAHKVASAVAGTAAVVVIGLVARHLAGDRAGWIAAALAALYPNLWVIEGILMPESLYALAIALVLLAAYRFYERPHAVAALLVGVAVGAAMLARGEAVFLLVLLGVPLAWRVGRPDWRVGLRTLAVFGAGAVAVVLPWTARNLASFDKPVWLSVNGDEVLRNANCPETYHGRLLGFWSYDCYRPEPPPGDESVRAAFWRTKGLEYVRGHLGRVPVVLAARVGRVWDVWRPGQNASLATVEGRSLRVAHDGQQAYWLLVPVAVAGAVVLRRRSVPLVPMGVMALLVTVASMYAYGVTRFRVPAEVAILILAGVALDAAARAVAERRKEAGA
jgi:4-amino-4-deoxy-L-arabinose transferase-like glycosyltransferase